VFTPKQLECTEQIFRRVQRWTGRGDGSSPDGPVSDGHVSTWSREDDHKRQLFLPGRRGPRRTAWGRRGGKPHPFGSALRDSRRADHQP